MKARALPVVLVLALAPQVASAGEARCAARVVHGRVLADVTVNELVRPELARLVKLGLPGQLEVELRLVRVNRVWFDAEVAVTHRTLTLSYDVAERRWTLGERSYEKVEPLALPRLVISDATITAEDTLRLEVNVGLQVVTAASLQQTAAWMAGEEDPVPEAVLRAVAETLRGTVEGRCVVTAPPPPGSEKPRLR